MTDAPDAEIADYDPDAPDLPVAQGSTCRHPDGDARDLSVVSGVPMDPDVDDELHDIEDTAPVPPPVVREPEGG